MPSSTSQVGILRRTNELAWSGLARTVPLGTDHRTSRITRSPRANFHLASQVRRLRAVRPILPERQGFDCVPLASPVPRSSKLTSTSFPTSRVRGSRRRRQAPMSALLLPTPPPPRMTTRTSSTRTVAQTMTTNVEATKSPSRRRSQRRTRLAAAPLIIRLLRRIGSDTGHGGAHLRQNALFPTISRSRNRLIVVGNGTFPVPPNAANASASSLGSEIARSRRFPATRRLHVGLRMRSRTHSPRPRRSTATAIQSGVMGTTL